MSIINKFISTKQTVESLSNKTKLIVACKNQSLDQILPIINYGHLDFGENKIQEAYIKWKDFIKVNSSVNLHFLGHLQTNKVSQVLEIFSFIHSLGSEKLALKLMNEENKLKKKLKYFIQVNIAEEKNKSGISHHEALDFIDFCKNELNLNIIGLMCLPPLNSDPREYFNKLKEIAISKKIEHLSMGMSQDYKIAINCGSTYVRIGSAIFN
jgi:pyridoxal phosphate enzyme (YggS family)